MPKAHHILLFILGIFAGLWLGHPPLSAAENPGDYFQIQKQMNDTLLFQKGNIQELVNAAKQSPSKNAKDATFRIALYMRTGMTKAALEAIQDLKRLAPELDNSSISQIYYSACDQYENWTVAKALVETFADNISDLAIRNRLVKYFQSQRWSVGQVDQWLKNQPARIDNFWLKTRLRFNKEYHQEKAIIRSLTDGVKQNPEDIGRVLTYLDMLTMVKSGDYQEWKLDWMREVIKPQRATVAQKIAQKLFRLSNYRAARHFFSEALRIPLTEEDIQEQASQSQAFRSTDQITIGFQVNTLEAYAKCMAKLRDVTAAQKLMLQANQLRGTTSVPDERFPGRRNPGAKRAAGHRRKNSRERNPRKRQPAILA